MAVPLPKFNICFSGVYLTSISGLKVGVVTRSVESYFLCIGRIIFEVADSSFSFSSFVIVARIIGYVINLLLNELHSLSEMAFVLDFSRLNYLSHTVFMMLIISHCSIVGLVTNLDLLSTIFHFDFTDTILNYHFVPVNRRLVIAQYHKVHHLR